MKRTSFAKVQFPRSRFLLSLQRNSEEEDGPDSMGPLSATHLWTNRIKTLGLDLGRMGLHEPYMEFECGSHEPSAYITKGSLALG